MAKTLYHSELAKAGRVLIKLTSDVTASKFAGKPPFIGMILNGEERNYSIESDACAATLRGRKGQTLLLEASGSGKDGSAAIQLFAAPAGATVTANAAPPASSAPPQQQAPPMQPPIAAATNWTQASESQRPPPPNQPAQTAAPASHATDYTEHVIQTRAFLARRGNLMRMAADEALRIVEGFSKAHGLPFDEAQKNGATLAIAEKLTETTFTTLYLSADRAGMTDAMPSGNLDAFVEAAKKRLAERASASTH